MPCQTKLHPRCELVPAFFASRYYRDNHLKRCDASGLWYTKQQFIDYYGAEVEWDAAVLTQHAEPETPHQHWDPDVKAMLHAGDHDEGQEINGGHVTSALDNPQRSLGQDADIVGEPLEPQERMDSEDNGSRSDTATEPCELPTNVARDGDGNSLDAVTEPDQAQE
eukprot:INCI16432.7.p1 GENE.INCI16432.7~~INCI16432.7.p1  ORF type:complete len:166 (+),score=24.97 INCI16432.7:260-757(+)